MCSAQRVCHWCYVGCLVVLGFLLQSMGLSPKVWQFLFFLSLCCIDIAGLVWIVWRLFEVSKESWNFRRLQDDFPTLGEVAPGEPQAQRDARLSSLFGFMAHLFICCS